MVHGFDKNIQVSKIVSGKLRRYHNISTIKQLLTPSILFLNIRDIFLTLFGIFQSFVKLIIWRPDVVFAKGGYVCLPVGFAAHVLRIPIVIHDSDAHPGLTNRILGIWAKMIATGAPLEYYSYSAKKSVYTGIPISEEFHEYSAKEKSDAKSRWGVRTDKPLIVITGGGLGAQRINDTVAVALEDLLGLGSVILISGSKQYDELRSLTPPNNNKFQMHSFISKDMASLLGAADVVITRAGATTIFELAAMAKPTILIPNGQLTGGHQVKNANVYSKNGAVRVVDENEMVEDPQVLVRSVKDVLGNPEISRQMAIRFSEFSRPDAAKDVADMVISSIK